jgi:hypothetical protein
MKIRHSGVRILKLYVKATLLIMYYFFPQISFNLAFTGISKIFFYFPFFGTVIAK